MRYPVNPKALAGDLPPNLTGEKTYLKIIARWERLQHPFVLQDFFSGISGNPSTILHQLNKHLLRHQLKAYGFTRTESLKDELDDDFSFRVVHDLIVTTLPQLPLNRENVIGG